jgi:FtsP/CotA-like multicopper oxidase with cupredoxin domain
MNREASRSLRRAALLGVALALGAAACSRSESRAEYWLCAKAGGVTMPDGVSVAIWGWVLDSHEFGNGCAGEPSLPGPALTVRADDPGLIVHVRNLLPEPTSIVIPGLRAEMTPVWTDGTTGPRTSPGQRVRSFTREAAPDGGEATYTWSGVGAGTWLYHSGTHPQVQVQMGLYGAVTRKVRPGVLATRPQDEVYPGVLVDAEQLLVFSEIDPAQHLAIANGSYGTAPAPTSTLRYAPRYFLVNGKPYGPSSAPLAIPAGKRTLLRLVNAGLQSYAPTLQGAYMQLVAQDGRLFPHPARPREQYSTLLPALGTVDAILAPPAASAGSRLALYDRRLHLTTGDEPDGGMLAFLAVTP